MIPISTVSVTRRREMFFILSFHVESSSCLQLLSCLLLIFYVNPTLCLRVATWSWRQQLWQTKAIRRLPQRFVSIPLDSIPIFIVSDIPRRAQNPSFGFCIFATVSFETFYFITPSNLSLVCPEIFIDCPPLPLNLALSMFSFIRTSIVHETQIIAMNYRIWNVWTSKSPNPSDPK